MNSTFRDRVDAGKYLADALKHYAGRRDVIVLGLPRGGVPVAYQIAAALRAPLDVLVVRKLGAPGEPELAMGAIATGGVTWIDRSIVRSLHVDPDAIDATIAREQAELARREAAYRGDRAPLRVEGRVAIVVDDGLATGASMHAALSALRAMKPAKTVVAVPVAPPGSAAVLRDLADEFVCVLYPDWFMSIGQFYDDFRQTRDEEVHDCLAHARAWGDTERSASAPAADGSAERPRSAGPSAGERDPD